MERTPRTSHGTSPEPHAARTACAPNDRSEIAHLLTSVDPDDLAEAARAFGRDLARRRHGEVGQVRRQLEDLARGDANPFVRGVALALENVASAFAAAEGEVDELAPLVRSVELRAGWKKVLLALADGALRASDIAERAGVSRGRVSHVAAGLERVGLLERSRVEGDGRERLCRLSPLGRQVIADLDRGPDPVAVDLDAAVVATTYMLAKLCARGRASRSALEDALAEHLDRRAVPQIADTVLRASRNAGLAVVSADEAVTLAEVHLQDILNDALEHAFDDEGPAMPVIDLARAQVPPGGVVLVRSELRRQRWDLVIAKRRLDDLRLVASADWFTGEIDRIVDRARPYVMVYDSPPLVRAERVTDSPARRLLGGAEHVFCYAVTGTVLPEGVNPLELA